jgi:transcriptional regulator with XRE-family HTH domain
MTDNPLLAMRKELGLTQAAMAERMGVPFRTYQDLETGTSAIRPIHVKAAAYAKLLEEGYIAEENVFWIHPFHVGEDGMLVDEPPVRVYGDEIEATAKQFFGENIVFDSGALPRILGSIAMVRHGKMDKRMVYAA